MFSTSYQPYPNHAHFTSAQSSSPVRSNPTLSRMNSSGSHGTDNSTSSTDSQPRPVIGSDCLRAKYLGCVRCATKSKVLKDGIQSVQSDILQLYATAQRRTMANGYLRPLTSSVDSYQVIDICNYGIVIGERDPTAQTTLDISGTLNAGNEDKVVMTKVITPLSNIVLWASIKFTHGVVKLKGHRVLGAAFIPLSCSQGVFKKNTFIRLRGKQKFLIGCAHPPLFLCILRKVSSPKTFECHLFACFTTQDAITISSKLSDVYNGITKVGSMTIPMDPSELGSHSFTSLEESLTSRTTSSARPASRSILSNGVTMMVKGVEYRPGQPHRSHWHHRDVKVPKGIRVDSPSDRYPFSVVDSEFSRYAQSDLSAVRSASATTSRLTAIKGHNLHVDDNKKRRNRHSREHTMEASDQGSSDLQSALINNGNKKKEPFFLRQQQQQQQHQQQQHSNCCSCYCDQIDNSIPLDPDLRQHRRHRHRNRHRPTSDNDIRFYDKIYPYRPQSKIKSAIKGRLGHRYSSTASPSPVLVISRPSSGYHNRSSRGSVRIKDRHKGVNRKIRSTRNGDLFTRSDESTVVCQRCVDSCHECQSEKYKNRPYSGHERSVRVTTNSNDSGYPSKSGSIGANDRPAPSRPTRTRRGHDTVDCDGMNLSYHDHNNSSTIDGHHLKPPSRTEVNNYNGYVVRVNHVNDDCVPDCNNNDVPKNFVKQHKINFDLYHHHHHHSHDDDGKPNRTRKNDFISKSSPQPPPSPSSPPPPPLPPPPPIPKLESLEHIRMPTLQEIRIRSRPDSPKLNGIQGSSNGEATISPVKVTIRRFEDRKEVASDYKQSGQRSKSSETSPQEKVIHEASFAPYNDDQSAIKSVVNEDDIEQCSCHHPCCGASITPHDSELSCDQCSSGLCTESPIHHNHHNHHGNNHGTTLSRSRSNLNTKNDHDDDEYPALRPIETTSTAAPITTSTAAAARSNLTRWRSIEDLKLMSTIKPLGTKSTKTSFVRRFGNFRFKSWVRKSFNLRKRKKKRPSELFFDRELRYLSLAEPLDYVGGTRIGYPNGDDTPSRISSSAKGIQDKRSEFFGLEGRDPVVSKQDVERTRELPEETGQNWTNPNVIIETRPNGVISRPKTAISVKKSPSNGLSNGISLSTPSPTSQSRLANGNHSQAKPQNLSQVDLLQELGYLP
ncbi:uncharacterized protein LOC141856532 [Brevipalpus obovatus]|uniref:uncharacterized protein LOC141856532 n=1 Tax=Brevipalpus obovatus TaxID=246614 RepID=UPI003D9FA8C0